MSVSKTLVFSLLLLTLAVGGKAQIMGRIGDSGNNDIYRSSTGRVRSAQEAETMRQIYNQQRTNSQMDARQATADRNFRNPTPRQEFESKMKSAKKFLAPEPEFRSQYNTFLDSPGAGLVKMFSEKPCSAEQTDKIKECPYRFIYGNARYFSFRSKEYVIDRWADLEYLNESFVSNGLDNQGILVNIGDVKLEDVTLDTKGIDFLKNFAPSVAVEEVGRQYMQILNEIEAGGFRYAKSLPIEAGKTYGLRAIAYERDVDLILNEQQKKIVKAVPELKKMMFDPLYGDKRQDVIVAFRVLQKTDGAVTIIWKELQRTKSPYIKAVGN